MTTPRELKWFVSKGVIDQVLEHKKAEEEEEACKKIRRLDLDQYDSNEMIVDS